MSARADLKKYKKVAKGKEKPEGDVPKGTFKVSTKGPPKQYISNVIDYLESEGRTVILQGRGEAITRVVSIAEVVKRRVKGLHTVSEITTSEVTDQYQKKTPSGDGPDTLEIKRFIAGLCVTLTLDTPDTSAPGYQEPVPDSEVQAEDKERRRVRGRGRGKGGRGGGRGNSGRVSRGRSVSASRGGGRPSRGGGGSRQGLPSRGGGRRQFSSSRGGGGAKMPSRGRGGGSYPRSRGGGGGGGAPRSRGGGGGGYAGGGGQQQKRSQSGGRPQRSQGGRNAGVIRTQDYRAPQRRQQQQVFAPQQYFGGYGAAYYYADPSQFYGMGGFPGAVQQNPRRSRGGGPAAPAYGGGNYGGPVRPRSRGGHGPPRSRGGGGGRNFAQ